MVRIILALVAWGIAATAAFAEVPQPPPDPRVAQVKALFSAHSDLASFKLKVDAMVDPQSDPVAVSRQIDDLTAALLPMAAGARSSHEKLKVLRRFLYESGPWNGNRPFAYDLDNPKGIKPEDKLLGYYIGTRKGNCITMPILLTILGQRLGMKMTLSLAPFHLFAKLTDETGKEWNIEATNSRGYTRDLWYRQELPMSDLAVSKGTYLRALTEEESKAVIAGLLMEKSLEDRQHEQTSITASVLLRHYPTFANALLFRGSAATYILREQLLRLFPDVNEMPPAIRAYADLLYRQNQMDFAAAEALGWTEKDGVKQ